MMRHKLQKLNDQRHRLLRNTQTSQRKDGLNSIVYSLVETRLFKGFTYFLFDVGMPDPVDVKEEENGVEKKAKRKAKGKKLVIK
jgi:hypothetical protein